MTTGDPKQAAILSIVAIGAIGFVVLRMIPRDADVPSIALSPRAAEKPKETAKKDFSTAVISNAFWHPKIGEKKTQVTPASGPKRMVEVDEIPPVSPFGRGDGPLRTVEITGNNQQLNQKPKIAVGAIIGTNGHREALITIDSAQRKVSVGSKVDGVEVIAMSDTAIRVRVGEKEVTVAVGEEKQL